MHGREMGTTGELKRIRVGYDYLHAAVDDHSPVAFVQAFEDERAATCAQFVRDAAAFFASEGIAIERVMTDNAGNYTPSKVFASALEKLAIAHRRTKLYGPQTNGKAERFNRTLLDEFA